MHRKTLVGLRQRGLPAPLVAPLSRQEEEKKLNRMTASGAKTAPSAGLAALALGLALLAPGAARAANLPYKIQPIVTLGDTVAGVPLPKSGTFALGGLSDDGQILFDVTAGGTDRFVLYAGGAFTPLAVPGGASPSGKWPSSLYLHGPGPQSMNARGDVVFAAAMGSGIDLGTFLRDAKSQTVTAVALKQMPAVNNRTITDPGGFLPVINNRGEIALVATISGPGAAGMGVFLREPDGSLQAVVLPSQPLPGGAVALLDYPQPSINDQGQVAFMARAQGGQNYSAYVWEHGTLSPVLLVGTDIPGAGKVHAVGSVTLNSKDGSQLVAATLEGPTGSHGVYHVAGGNITPVAVPGQVMPDGGQFKTLESFGAPPLDEPLSLGVTAANAAGQHAFIAILEDGSTAAYTVDLDGKLSLILKSGTVTDVGTITSLGAGSDGGNDIGLNAQGQVLLVASIDNGPRTLLLLTPTTP